EPRDAVPLLVHALESQPAVPELAGALSGTIARLGPGDAGPAASLLLQALKDARDSEGAVPFAKALTRAADRLGPAEAAAVTGQAAAFLVQSLGEVNDPGRQGLLGQALEAVGAGAEPREVVRLVTQAVKETKDPNTQGWLARILAGVAARQGPEA